MKTDVRNFQMDDLSHFKLKNKIKKIIVIDIISGLFFLLFLYAAVNKLLDYQQFKVQVGQSPLLVAFADQVVWIIPIVEILISILLFIPKRRLLALYASFTLMTMFTFYIVAILKFSDYIPCSCGGVLEKMSWSAHLIFNILFVVIALVGIILQTKINADKTTNNVV